jgi:hypothetical protein
LSPLHIQSFWPPLPLSSTATDVSKYIGPTQIN